MHHVVNLMMGRLSFLFSSILLILTVYTKYNNKHYAAVLQVTENASDTTSVTVILPGQVQHAAFQIAVLLITVLVKANVFYRTLARVFQLLTANIAIKRQNPTPMHPSSTTYFITQPSWKTLP